MPAHLPRKHSRTHQPGGSDPLPITPLSVTVIAAYVRRDESSPQSIGSSSSYDEAIEFEIQEYDSHGLWDPGSPTRLTVPFNGVYVVTATGGFASNSTGDRAAAIFKNGTENMMACQGRAPDNYFWGGPCAVTDLFTAGDYVELKVAQNSGSNLNTGDCWLSCFAVGIVTA